ncbi:MULTISPECIES: YqcC family protein [Gammaproteobacteria]|uniref:YqcC family protein n=1 Tax=Gammaproteobacteria TaxID=1236 RepID=UPI000DD07D1B|nr:MULTISPECIES: YqcC family protein [Gammaproteobacteria]RTE86988.1 YqcC family protein [Aliidiomarina sp. B3213]TCZ93222.1 YqcC family protein [Lysobacter sp. N42]
MHSSDFKQQLSALIRELRDEMQGAELWDSKAPSQKALKSTQPFAYDTLEFYQWLQFIFIPNMKERIDKKKPLPNRLEVSPMAEEAWRGNWKERRQVILVLRKIDEMFKSA